MITEKKISETLRKLGIPTAFIGFEYLLDGLMLIAGNGKTRYTKNFVSSFYGDIASLYDTEKKTRIERAIRHAISVSFDAEHNNNDFQKEVFGHFPTTKNCPTNKEYVFCVYEYLRLDETEG